MVNLKHFFIDLIIEKPKVCLIIVLAILSLSVPGIIQLESDFNYKIWFQDDDPELTRFDNFQKVFGNDEVMIVAVHNPQGVINKADIKMIRDLSEEMWQVQGVIDVESLSNYYHSFNEGDDEISIEELFPSSLGSIDFKKRSLIALNNPGLKDTLINTKGTLGLIYAKQKPYFDSKPDERAIVEQTRNLVNKYRKAYPHLIIYMAGGLVVGNTYREVAERDLFTLLPIMFTVIGCFLFLFFRSFSIITIPFIITIFSATFSFSLAGYLGITFNNILGLIPQALMAIAIADSVHVITNYLQFRKEGLVPNAALKKSLQKNFYPTFLTTISTTIGFLSFLTVSMEPLVNFGLLSAFGTVAAWFCTYLCSPLLVVFDKGEKSSKKRNIIFTPSSFLKYINQLERFRYPILVIVFLSAGLSIYYGFQNQINTNPIKYFKSDIPARKANDFILKQLGGLPGPEIVVDSQSNSGIYDPEFLGRVEDLINQIESSPSVIKVNSLLDIIRQMNQALNNGDKEAYRIPKKRKTIAEEIFLYQMSLSEGKNLNDKISLNERYMRLSLLWSLQNSEESLLFIEKIKAQAKKLNLSIVVTGKNPLFLTLNNKVSLSLLYSLSIALLLVSIFLLITFKSFSLALISLFPNIFPLIIGSAVMYMSSIPLSVGSALVFSVCLGIVVDDTIHFLMRYKEVKARQPDTKTALSEVLYTTGTSILATTIILSIGFGLFIFAQFNLNVHFGLISATIFITALIADLVFLPVLLITLTKDKKTS